MLTAYNGSGNYVVQYSCDAGGTSDEKTICSICRKQRSNKLAQRKGTETAIKKAKSKTIKFAKTYVKYIAGETVYSSTMDFFQIVVKEGISRHIELYYS